MAEFWLIKSLLAVIGRVVIGLWLARGCLAVVGLAMGGCGWSSKSWWLWLVG